MAEKIKVLVVEPQKAPYMKEIESSLESLQREVGGFIQATYPYPEAVALICNEEGKLEGLPHNRVLRDEDGDIYDYVAGTFLITGLGEEDFTSLGEQDIEKFTKLFKTPERFVTLNGHLCVFPMDEARPVPQPRPHPPKTKSYEQER